MNGILKIGTRGSPLALTQTEMVRSALARAVPGLQTEIVVIQTSGDWRSEQGEVRLSALAGGKAQFAKELQEALLTGAIDCAVHSMKDMAAVLPDGLVIRHMLPREDVRDAVLLRDRGAGIGRLEDLPKGARVGTSSVRRQAFLLARRPDLEVTVLRGNVQTRIDKLRAGQADATLLAVTGLKRLGLEAEIAFVLEPEICLPAAGQGAVGIEINQANSDILSIFDQIYCKPTTIAVTAERAMLAALGGSCHTPIGALAVWQENEILRLTGALASLDGAQIHGAMEMRPVRTMAEAEALGRVLGERLKTMAPPELLEQIAGYQ